jgi:hypothetical protein
MILPSRNGLTSTVPIYHRCLQVFSKDMSSNVSSGLQRFRPPDYMREVAFVAQSRHRSVCVATPHRRDGSSRLVDRTKDGLLISVSRVGPFKNVDAPNCGW